MVAVCAIKGKAARRASARRRQIRLCMSATCDAPAGRVNAKSAKGAFSDANGRPGGLAVANESPGEVARLGRALARCEESKGSDLRFSVSARATILRNAGKKRGSAHRRRA